MAVPFVGQMVHYYPYQSEYVFEYNTKEGHPHAAVVTYVHSHTLVNLAVFDMNGKQFRLTSVTYHKGGEKPAYGYCQEIPPEK